VLLRFTHEKRAGSGWGFGGGNSMKLMLKSAEHVGEDLGKVFKASSVLRVHVHRRWFDGCERSVQESVGSVGERGRPARLPPSAAGLLVLLGVGKEDAEADADYLADKVVNLRIFEDETRPDEPLPSWTRRARCWSSRSSRSTATRGGGVARASPPPPTRKKRSACIATS
jgi:hypothetical protein